MILNFHLRWKTFDITVFCSDDCVYIAHADIFDSFHSLRGNYYRDRCRGALEGAGIKGDEAIKNFTHYSQYPAKLNRVQRECLTFLHQLATRGSLNGEGEQKRTESGYPRLALHFYLHMQTKGGNAGNSFPLSRFMDGFWTYKKGQGVVYHRY